jgi:N-methylhydantoinase B/oxoprolinase/acetone carboxylase alpha subunit
MGRTLQRTSVSVNIKERLDFSCALFDPYGALVANAPHLPVHLGAMSEAVRYQVHRFIITRSYTFLHELKQLFSIGKILGLEY